MPIYLFTFLDILKLDSLFKYRLHYARSVSGHLDTRHYPPMEVIKDVAKTAEFNFLFAYAVPGYLAISAANKLGIHVYDTDRELTWKRLAKEVLLISVVADFCFYGLHRLMHTPEFYQAFHKKHHVRRSRSQCPG
jgi:sterol desaturase/sphingolipid hydroxylase (fatty acid hydroxylase superfamily)